MLLSKFAQLSLRAMGSGAPPLVCGPSLHACARALGTAATPKSNGRRAKDGKPKRPSTAYILFCKDELSRMQTENSILRGADRMKAAAEKYQTAKESGATALAQYEAAAAADKKRYEKELTAFRESNGADKKKHGKQSASVAMGASADAGAKE